MSSETTRRWLGIAIGAFIGGSFLWYVVTGKERDEEEEEKQRAAEEAIAAKRKEVQQRVSESFGSQVGDAVSREMDRIAQNAQYEPPIPRDQVLAILKDTLKSAPATRTGLGKLSDEVKAEGLSVEETYLRAQKERPQDAFERAGVSLEAFNQSVGIFLHRNDKEIAPYVSQVLGVQQGEIPSASTSPKGKKTMNGMKSSKLKYRDVVEAEEYKLVLLRKFAADPFVGADRAPRADGTDGPLDGKVLWFAAQAWSHAGVGKKFKLNFEELSYALDTEFAEREKASPSQARIQTKTEIQKINVELLSRGS
jgi:hypothetical protein